MDPQACLNELETLLNDLEAQIDAEEELDMGDVRSAVEHLQNLQEWQSKNGFCAEFSPSAITVSRVRLESVLAAVRAQYAANAKGPGKFEGQEGHVLYVYERSLEGTAEVILSDDCGGKSITEVGIDEIDAIIFPELANSVGKSFYLHESSTGFVSEIDEKAALEMVAEREAMEQESTYHTFLRSARNFEEFASADKIEQDVGLSHSEAMSACQGFNSSRTAAEIELGTKMEFEKE